MRKILISVLLTFFLFFLACGKVDMGGRNESVASYTEKEPAASGDVKAYSNVDQTGIAIDPMGPPGAERQTAPAFKDKNDADGTVSDGEAGDKKIYTGYQKLRVKSIEETKSRVIELTEQAGGYVERLYTSYIVLRIPKAKFSESFETILTFGEVMNKSIQTFDVSEFFQDLSLRLDIAVKSRSRLYALLEKTSDVKERLKILKEISRLSEEIERINLSLESLKQLISYSKITVEFVPRLEREGRWSEKRIPFEWIGNLDAFRVSLPDLKGIVKMELPDDFAVFTRSGNFHAETSDGTVVRIGTAKNKPEGDNDFWQEALMYHLGPLYEKAEKMDLGNYKAVLFTSRDREPYYYLVALQVQDADIRVIEIVFPDEAHKLNQLDDLTGRIRGLK